MKKTIKQNKPIIFSILLMLLVGMLYCLAATPIYQISGSATIVRSSLPPLVNLTPETRNRWVWVRDGLSMKEVLKQDKSFLEFVKNSEELKKRFKTYSSSHPFHSSEDLLISFIRTFKKNIDIKYTGGDSNTFIFTVRDPNPKLGKEIVTMLINKLRYLNDEIMFSNNKFYLNELSNNIIESGQGKQVKYRDTVLSAVSDAYGRLYVENILQNAQSKNIFKTIDTPFIPPSPMWPRMDLVLLLCALGGLALGLVIQYLSSTIKIPASPLIRIRK